MSKFIIPSLGEFADSCGLIDIEKCSDGYFEKGKEGVCNVYSTGDRKAELICFADRTIVYVRSMLGYPAYYPLKKVKLEYPIKAVLMDLDGTSVKSEEFWIWIIERTSAMLLNDESFKLSSEDLPYVSGHSVSEHLKYCIEKYCPNQTLDRAREIYFENTHKEMEKILAGKGRENAFTPSKGIKEFLLALKEREIKVGLVTSGLYEKAWPEILSAFQSLNMGDPKDFYDCSITAGYPLGKGKVGTLGELSPKPHPWLYAETACVGLNVAEEDRSHVLGIEDSGAGVCSIRLAGFATIGVTGGNIETSGCGALCGKIYDGFDKILDLIDGKERLL